MKSLHPIKRPGVALFSHGHLLLLTGLTIITAYEANLAKIVAEEQELANVANLLDLPVSVFPQVCNIQKEMKALRQIYHLYKAQKVRLGILGKVVDIYRDPVASKY